MDNLSEEDSNALIVLSQQTNEIVIITDELGKFKWVNQGFIDLTKYTFEEVRGYKPGEILQGPETDPDTVKEVSIAIKKRISIKTNIINYDKYGKKYWLRMFIRPVMTNGVLTGFVATEIDLTENFNNIENFKKLSEKYKRERDDKQEMIRLISHDFKNLLNTTINLSDIVLGSNRDKIEDNKLNVTLIKEISNNSKSMLKLLEGYLEKNTKCLLFDPIEAKAFIKNILLDINIKKVPKFINLNDLQVIINNLLINAIKFTQKNGKISAKTDENSESFNIMVKDNGIGIPEGKIDTIFEENYTTMGTDGENGTGFGLSKCKKLVEKNGGTIHVHSFVNIGTTIHLKFHKASTR